MKAPCSNHKFYFSNTFHVLKIYPIKSINLHPYFTLFFAFTLHSIIKKTSKYSKKTIRNYHAFKLEITGFVSMISELFLFFFNFVALRFFVFCMSSKLISPSFYGFAS